MSDDRIRVRSDGSEPADQPTADRARPSPGSQPRSPDATDPSAVPSSPSVSAALVGIGPLEREQLSAGISYVTSQDVICLSSSRHWQSKNSNKPGFRIPPDSLTQWHHPVLAGHVPARTLSDGGYVEVLLHGYFRSSAQPPAPLRMLVRCDLDGAYAGPDWGAGLELGWGWWSEDARDDDAQLLRQLAGFDWSLRLCVHSLGGRDGVELADGTPRNLMLRGQIEARSGEILPFYNAQRLASEADGAPVFVKPIFQYVVPANPSPRRALELVISVAGGQRQDGGAGDQVQVHGGDIFLYGPRLGYSFGDHSLADPID